MTTEVNALTQARYKAEDRIRLETVARYAQKIAPERSRKYAILSMFLRTPTFDFCMKLLELHGSLLHIVPRQTSIVKYTTNECFYHPFYETIWLFTRDIWDIFLEILFGHSNF
jgi:hypothetical protein